MSVFRSKPVLVAGFSIFCASLSLLLSGASAAQDYIDVEAEREAARRSTGSEQTPPSAYSSDAPASVAAGPAASDPSTAYSQSGIRPYSGQTITAQPVDAAPVGNAGMVDVGSVVIQLQQLQEEVRRLNGIVEEQASQIQRLKEQSLERYVDLDRRLAGVSASAAPMVGDNSQNGVQTAGNSAGASAAAVAPAAQPGEEAAYQSAYDFVKARDFGQAVTAFKAFLSNYPFGRYAPNAHYWLGELYLVITPADPELARQSFKLLLDQYPDNPKVPDALYKLGKVQYLKGNRDRSREYLDRVLSEYPGHPAAQLAQDFIRENF